MFNDSAIMCPGHGFVLAERRRSRGCNVSWLLHLVALQARIVNLSFVITPVQQSLALRRSLHTLVGFLLYIYMTRYT